MEPFIGEIKLFAGDYTPRDWAPCDGRLLPIKEYDGLYSLLGDAYGGDGQTTFAVPDLRGRALLHRSATIPLARTGGVEDATITSGQVASHGHVFFATKAPADRGSPDRMALASSNTIKMWSGEDPAVAMAPEAIGPAPGNGSPHENMHPFLALTYIIATAGIYPPRN